MTSHLISSIVILGMASAVAGCASAVSSGNGSDHQRLKKPPAVIAIVDGITQIAPIDHSPTESVKTTINDVLFILGNEALQQPGRSEERRLLIEQVIKHRVNFGQMSQRSLGPSWTTLTDRERQEFVSLFVQLLRDTFANKIDQYYDEQVFYLFEQREGNFAEVKTNLIGPKVDTSLDFRLEHNSGDWLVYDVVIDGTSIVKSYRTQFNRIIRDSAYAGLVERMKQRVHSVKGFEKTAPAIAQLPGLTSTSQ